MTTLQLGPTMTALEYWRLEYPAALGLLEDQGRALAGDTERAVRLAETHGIQAKDGSLPEMAWALYYAKN